ncbi:uncharacterized protein OGAPODRAFT_17173 [Ogataea polymorpha]|uniref:uncharacterized protein n=1 Tax=Ogataea polymorpha TaxID=460523 RepID=UPI0007F4836C|nr:uncharacterized protein OGAPODRAFT_17173 [Ogataea polymorpha]OBA14346.1 hypothetical protein OGAPODRAFT_17173 [Ogataea polymorpha]
MACTRRLKFLSCLWWFLPRPTTLASVGSFDVPIRKSGCAESGVEHLPDMDVKGEKPDERTVVLGRGCYR